jgi:hypothetical protein
LRSVLKSFHFKNYYKNMHFMYDLEKNWNTGRMDL